ncbi:MAG: GGDEF domain-containing protein [Sulfurimonas sp.]
MNYTFKKYFLFFYFFILIAIVVSFATLYIISKKSQEKQVQSMLKVEIAHVQNFSKNIEKNILHLCPNNIVKDIQENTSKRDALNAALSLLVGKEYRYVFVVYKDTFGTFRYLGDGSHELSQRGDFNQKFMPLLSIWDKVLLSKEATFSMQKDISGLWITYLRPIVRNGKVEAILAFDIANEEYNSILNVVNPLNKIILIVSIFVLIVLIFNFIQAFLYVKQIRKTNIDPLTHLYNRNYFKDAIVDMDLHNCAIIMADIDYFKRVNDTYGHDAGDVVLQSVAKRLLSATRVFDTVIRYGGEEFLIILHNIHDLETINEVCERILKVMSSQTIRVMDEDINVTLSLGVNTNPSSANSINGAIIKADTMLYKAKENGRNRAEFTL